MSPLVRRVSLFAAAGAAGFLAAAAAYAATESKAPEAKVERRVVIVQDGPDGHEVRIEGPDGFSFEMPDLAEFRDLAGEMMPMMRALHPGGPLMRDPEQRAEHLREMLQLRADQEAALQAFVSATSETPTFERAEHEVDEDLTTPQRLARARARMAEHQAAFERRADAVTRFYDQLSPSQKTVFDKLPGADGIGEHAMRIVRIDRDGMGDHFKFRVPKPPKPPKAPTPPAAPKAPS
jgi:hypothetical protein